MPGLQTATNSPRGLSDPRARMGRPAPALTPDTEPGLCTGGRPGSAPQEVVSPVLCCGAAARSPGSGVLVSPSRSGPGSHPQARATLHPRRSAAQVPASGDCEQVTACVSRLRAHVDEPSYLFCYFWLFRV